METRPQAIRAAAGRSYPRAAEALPEGTIPGGSYQARFARSSAEVERIQRLRFEVFNLELGEGLPESFEVGLDRDVYDPGCHHLMVVQRESDAVVGTYRVQTRAMAEANHGWYTAGEFDLARVPREILDEAVETGRACVGKDHRNGRVLTLLWKGLAQYLAWNKKRYLFGCCSLTSQDPHVAKATYDFLSSGSFLHPELAVPPRPGFECYPRGFRADLNTSVKLPPLFASYLKLGSKITGEPAIDREFRTIDFLTVLDTQALEAATRRTFFG